MGDGFKRVLLRKLPYKQRERKLTDCSDSPFHNYELRKYTYLLTYYLLLITYYREFAVLSNYFENKKTWGKSVLGMKYGFRFYLQHLFKKCFDPINIQQITFEVRTETYTGLQQKCLLFLPNFSQKWNVFVNVRTPNIKLHENPWRNIRVGPCGQTDTQTQQSEWDVFSQFFFVANAPKIRIH
jgi:hypothetical protein